MCGRASLFLLLLLGRVETLLLRPPAFPSSPLLCCPTAPSIPHPLLAWRCLRLSSPRPPPLLRVRAVSSERRPGNPRGKRGGRGRAVRPQPDSLAAFVRGTDRSRLLEHADEILLCKRVQLLRKVEATRAMMLRKAAETATQAAAERLQPAGGVWDGGGSAATSAAHVLGEGETVASVSFPEWAAAEGMTEAELRAIIADGREAEAAIIGANIGLVKSAIAAMKRTSGGRIDQGTTEQDLMQEGSLSLVKVHSWRGPWARLARRSYMFDGLSRPMSPPPPWIMCRLPKSST